MIINWWQTLVEHIDRQAETFHKFRQEPDIEAREYIGKTLATLMYAGLITEEQRIEQLKKFRITK